MERHAAQRARSLTLGVGATEGPKSRGLDRPQIRHSRVVDVEDGQACRGAATGRSTGYTSNRKSAGASPSVAKGPRLPASRETDQISGIPFSGENGDPTGHESQVFEPPHPCSGERSETRSQIPKSSSGISRSTERSVIPAEAEIEVGQLQPDQCRDVDHRAGPVRVRSRSPGESFFAPPAAADRSVEALTGA